jgi:L-fuculose-phosphate aldolase
METGNAAGFVKEEFRQMIAEGGREMVSKGLTVGTWGNLSIRDPQTGLIYIKPSAMNYDEITAEDVVVFTSTGEIVAGRRKPSVEFHFHLAVMNARPDINAVIHTHPVYSAVLGVLGWDLPGISEDFVQLVGDKIVNCRYALPGSRELAGHIVAALSSDRLAALIPNHGTVCCGKNWETAVKVCFVVEKTAHIYLLARNAGTPNLISPEDIAAMRDFARNHYGR